MCGDLDFETDDLALPERWILSRLSRPPRRSTASFESFRFDEACGRLYHFFWSDFCDWYIEMAKPAPRGEPTRPAVPNVLLTVLDRALRLLHPVMPHLTEELWQRLPGHESVHDETICLAPWPMPARRWELSSIDAERMKALKRVVLQVRNLRAGRKLAPNHLAELFVESLDGQQAGEWIDAVTSRPLLRSLGGIESTAFNPDGPQVKPLFMPPDCDVFEIAAGVRGGLRFEQVEGRSDDPEKLREELTEVEANLERVRARLANPGFAAKAPAAVVEGARRQLAELEERRARLAGSTATASGS